jgi:hypothetical protein
MNFVKIILKFLIFISNYKTFNEIGMKLKLRFLLIFYLISKISFAQNSSTCEFFPFLYSKENKLCQIYCLTSKDTIEYAKFEFNLIQEKKSTYLITSSFDSNNNLISYLSEEVTPKGLKFNEGKVFNYGSNNTLVVKYDVKGKTKITFPFIELSQMKNWKTKWKTYYDNKIVIKSTFEFLEIDSILFEGQYVEVIKLKRTVTKKYKRDYQRAKEKYEIILFFSKNYGLVKFTRTGTSAYEGVLINN